MHFCIGASAQSINIVEAYLREVGLNIMGVYVVKKRLVQLN